MLLLKILLVLLVIWLLYYLKYRFIHVFNRIFNIHLYNIHPIREAHILEKQFLDQL